MARCPGRLSKLNAMRVAIAGAHGKIAQLLAVRLIRDRHEVLGFVRNRDHVADLEDLGVSASVCDLESIAVPDLAAALAGCDAAVFAAGAGPGSGAERKLTVDRDGAIKLLEAATVAGVERFLIVSSVGAEDPPSDNEAFSVYLRAKAEADAAVQASDRRWTVIRPGALTDAAGTGRVRIDRQPYRGEVSREDVAAVLGAVLGDARAVGTTLYVNGGDREIAAALADAFAGP